MVECLPEMDVPFPGFETQGWELVLQAPVFLTIGSNTADLLVHAYNRMRSANDQLDRLRDLVLGDSALRVALANASTVRYSGDSEPGIDKVIGEYLEHIGRKFETAFSGGSKTSKNTWTTQSMRSRPRSRLERQCRLRAGGSDMQDRRCTSIGPTRADASRKPRISPPSCQPVPGLGTGSREPPVQPVPGSPL
jgi:hypothetical protein